MTHDELVGEIDHFLQHYPADEMALALRAVVVLHKPQLLCDCGECKAMACQRCQTFESCLDYYPCLTIQAIENELK